MLRHDRQSIMSELEGEQHMFAAAQHIMKAIERSQNLSDSFRMVAAELDRRLSKMSIKAAKVSTGFTEVEELLRCAERKIMHWESKVSRIWDAGNTEAFSEYLQAVKEVLNVLEYIGSSSAEESGKQQELLRQAQCDLQTAISRLEKELYELLLQHKQWVEPQYTSFNSTAVDVVYDGSFNSTEHEIIEEISGRESNGREDITESATDTIDPQVLLSIKSIANIMFASSYAREFCEVLISARRTVLDEYLTSLEMENLSIEDVLKLEWDCLNSKIKKWMWAMKNIISLYMVCENRLCDRILGRYDYCSSLCFMEILKAPILCLLNFGQAVAMGPHKPEKIKRLLDMYDAMANLQLHVDTLFSEEAGSLVRIEFHEAMKVLGESAKTTFLQFRNAIASDECVNLLPGGGIHPLTRYVMNYITVLVDYATTLNSLLRDVSIDHPSQSQMDDGEITTSSTLCATAYHFFSMTSTLEANLFEKSRLYNDEVLQHIFLMNNIHYMVQKVKHSELNLFFGDDWIKRHSVKFMQHATSYQRATWSSVVSLLAANKKISIKDKCKRFCSAFDEIYKVQTRWCIPDPELRDDVQIAVSQKVVPAYRTFLGVNNGNVNDRYVKYSAEDVETMLLDLFGGLPIPKRNSLRRSSLDQGFRFRCSDFVQM